MKVCIDPVFLHLPCYNINHASHSIRTVKYRGWPSQYLYTLGQKRLVGIGYRMTENPGILRMTVNHDHQLGRTSTQSAQRNAARRSG